MKHLEIEMKTLLSKEEYDRLLAQFSEVTPVTQKNYYLDTPDFYLRHHKIAMRIRTFDTSAELTIKIPQEVGNMEYNQDLTLEEAGVKVGKTPSQAAQLLREALKSA